MLEDQSPKGPRHVAIIMDGNGRWAQSRDGLGCLGTMQVPSA